MHFAEVRHLAGQPSFRNLVQDNRLWLVELEEHGRMDVDADQDESWVVGRPVARIAFIGKPEAPVGRVQLVDLLAVARERRKARDRDPLPRSNLVVREIDVGIRFQVPNLVRGVRMSRTIDPPPPRASGSPWLETRDVRRVAASSSSQRRSLRPARRTSPGRSSSGILLVIAARAPKSSTPPWCSTNVSGSYPLPRDRKQTVGGSCRWHSAGPAARRAGEGIRTLGPRFTRAVL